MQLAVEIYIYILSGNAQASFTPQVTSERTSEKFHKKGTGEGTGEDYSFSSLSIHADNPSQIGLSFKPRVASDSIWWPS